MMNPNSVGPGIYQHYKGNLYVVTAVTIDGANTEEYPWNKFVTYYPLTGHDFRACTRTLADFIAAIKWPDEKTRSRFTRVELEASTGVLGPIFVQNVFYVSRRFD